MPPFLKKILLVEDDPDIQKIARLSLESIGKFEVKVCSSGKEALDQVAGFGPDLIVMDVMMPGLDGPTTFKAMKQMPSAGAIPVIFMTAKIQGSEIENYKKMGVVDILRKPFDPMTLSDEIKQIWERIA